MKLTNRRMLSLLMAIIMVLTMIPFHPLEVRAAATPTLDLGYPVKVTEVTYQLPNATFGSKDVVDAKGGYFTVAVNSGSIDVGALPSDITELTNGIKISDKETDKSTPTNRVFNFTSDTTYEKIQAAIRNMTFTQVSGQTQSVTVNVMPGAPLTDGKTSVRTYNGRHFVYVARQSTMTFYDAVTIATNNNGHLVEPAKDNPGEMLAIASLFKDLKSSWSGGWYFISFIGATKTTAPNWSTPGSSGTNYVSNGQPTGLESTSNFVPNGTLHHLTLLLDTNGSKIGYLAVDNTHGGSSAYKDPGVIVEYNSGVISNIITTTKDIKLLPVMGGSVTIDGIAKAGQTLTANVTGITYTPDTTGNVPTYQWYRNGVAITNATGSSYTLTADDLGATITLTVTADGTHAVGSVTSLATAVVTKGDGPAAPSAPVASSVTPASITLQPVSGQEYSMDGGLTWQDSPTFNGLTPGTDYTFVTRVKATATQMASAVSPATTIRTSVGEPTLEITEPASGTVTVSKPVFKGTAAPGSKITVNIADGITGTVTADTYGNWSYIPEVNLADGNYTVKVTATKDGKSSTVSKELTVNTADHSSLTGLQLNSWNGTPIGLSPAFNGSTTKYTASVTNSVYSVTVSSLPLDPNAKIEVSVNNGPWQQVANGAASGNLPLNVGTNTIVVKVTDAKGHVTEYTLTITRESSDSGDSDSSSGGSTTTPSTSAGSSSSGGSTTPNGSGIETSVNGKDDAFATGKESTSGDRKVTSVQVDLDKLNKAVSQGNGQKLAIHSSKDGDMKVDGLTAGAVKQLADKGSSLEISNPLAIYPVPGGKMDLSAVSKQLGNAALGDIAVHIDIARSSDTLITNAKNKAAAEGYELLVTPVDLDMTFSHDGKMVRAGQLNGYAAKYIALPEGIDPNRITTGVIVNPDGSVFHVPTVVTKINSRYYALIKDLRSNGSYSVIWNPQDFDDVKSHWGKADVNNIAARLDLAGTGNNTFSPDRNVTRSEFSEIVVAGLGLKRQNAPQNKFPDVSDSAWYRNSVAIANEFDIVRGYEDGNFYGDRQITREQGMAMIARAYKLIETKAALSQEQTDALLAKYEDAKKVSAWAREDIALMIEAGIVQGNGPQLLSPQSNMTRAEVTALIARLLKTTNLIDK